MGGVAFTTPDVGRVFLACDLCKRVVPHYHLYGESRDRSRGRCACGGTLFRPRAIPEWQAMVWVLVVGWFWRKTIRREVEWDPRMPIRSI